MVELVSIPEGLFRSFSHKQQIIRFDENCSEDVDLSDRIAHYLKHGTNIGRLEPILEFPEISMLDCLKNDGLHNLSVILRVSDNQLGDIHRYRSLVCSIKPRLVYEGYSTSLPRSVQFLSSLNLPIEIDPDVIMSQTAASLLDLADRLLFSPFMKITVQPVFELLQSVITGDGSSRFSLWNACGENLGRDYFVNQNGQISLSRRWAEKDRYFGNISSSIEEMQASSLYKEIHGITRQDKFANPECVSCQAKGFCSGFLRALDASYDCGPFLTLHTFLDNQSAILKKSLVTLPNQKKQEIAEAIANSTLRVTQAHNCNVGPTPKPISAIVYVSDKCINNCIFCAPAEKRSHNNELTDTKIKEFILSCSARGTKIMTLSGAGEPSLNPSLAELVSFAKKSGIKKTFITSSGAAMSADLLRRLKDADNNGFIFSLHGLLSEHDAAVQRRGAFRKLLEVMSFARKLEMEVGLNTCLLKANLQQIEELINLGKSYCTMEHTLCFPEWSGNALYHIDLLLTYRMAFQKLVKLKWSDYDHVFLDNFPLCFVPQKAKCVQPASVISYMDLSTSKYLSTALNFGNNIIPDCCQANGCSKIDICTGIDRQYLLHYGLEELDLRLKKMRDSGNEF